MKNTETRRIIIELLDNWLDSKIASVSTDRPLVLAAKHKVYNGFEKLSHEEAETILGCMMEEVNAESIMANDIVDFVQAKTIK